MIFYKGAKCFYVGLGQWRVRYDGIEFIVWCRSGIKELLDHIDHWRTI